MTDPARDDRRLHWPLFRRLASSEFRGQTRVVVPRESLYDVPWNS